MFLQFHRVVPSRDMTYSEYVKLKSFGSEASTHAYIFIFRRQFPSSSVGIISDSDQSDSARPFQEIQFTSTNCFSLCLLTNYLQLLVLFFSLKITFESSSLLWSSTALALALSSQRHLYKYQQPV